MEEKLNALTEELTDIHDTRVSENGRNKASEENTMKEFTIAETLKISRILKENGIILKGLKTTKEINGKSKYIFLEEIKQYGMDIQNIIKENKLDPKYPYGRKISELRRLYRGNYRITEEEKKKLKLLG